MSGERPADWPGPGCVVPGLRVGGAQLGPGSAIDFNPPQAAVQGRQLDPHRVRRQLPRAVAPTRPLRLDLLSDLSGSMTGGNDVVGLRHEASLIALEHLAAGQRRQARWEAEIRSFDLSSPLDTGPLVLDRKGLAAAERALLSKPYGGSSNLGPSLDAAEASSADRVLVVLSDFELFDPDVPAVLDRLIRASAREVLALVFTSQPPRQLLHTRVRVHSIATRTSRPEEIAVHIVEAANAAAGARLTGHRAAPGGRP